MPEALDSVCMKADAPLSCDPSDLGNRLNRPDLIVRVHNGDQDRPRRQRPSHVSGSIIPEPSAQYVTESHPFEVFASFEHGVVLKCRGYNVVALCPHCGGDPLEGEIITFRSASGKHDFVRFGKKERGDPVSRPFDGALRTWPNACRLAGFPNRSPNQEASPR